MDNEYKEVLFDKYCPTCAYKNVADVVWPCDECLDHTCNLNSNKPVNYVDKNGNEAAEKPRLLDPIQKQITQNGTYRAREEGSVGYSTVDVNVRLTLQNKTVTPTISKQNITSDANYDGLKTVTVEAIPVATTEEVKQKFGGAVNG